MMNMYKFLGREKSSLKFCNKKQKDKIVYLAESTLIKNGWRFEFSISDDYIGNIYPFKGKLYFEYIYPQFIQTSQKYSLAKYSRGKSGYALEFKDGERTFRVETSNEYHLKKLVNIEFAKAVYASFRLNKSGNRTFLNLDLSIKSQEIALSDCKITRKSDSQLFGKGVWRQKNCIEFRVSKSYLDRRSILNLRDGFKCIVEANSSKEVFVVNSIEEALDSTKFEEYLYYYGKEISTDDEGKELTRYQFKYFNSKSNIEYKCSIKPSFFNIESIDVGAAFIFEIQHEENQSFGNLKVLKPIYSPSRYQARISFDMGKVYHKRALITLNTRSSKVDNKTIRFIHEVEDKLQTKLQMRNDAPFLINAPLCITKHEKYNMYYLKAEIDNMLSSPFKGTVTFVEKINVNKRDVWVFKELNSGVEFTILETELLHFGLAELPEGYQLEMGIEKPPLPKQKRSDTADTYKKKVAEHKYYMNQWRITSILSSVPDISPTDEYKMVSLYDWRAMFRGIVLESDQAQSYPAFFDGALVFKVPIGNGVSVAVFTSKLLLEEMAVRHVPKDTEARGSIRYCDEQQRYLITSLELQSSTGELDYLKDTLTLKEVDTNLDSHWQSINHPEREVTKLINQFEPFDLVSIIESNERYQFDVLLKKLRNKYSIKKFISVRKI